MFHKDILLRGIPHYSRRLISVAFINAALSSTQTLNCSDPVLPCQQTAFLAKSRRLYVVLKSVEGTVRPSGRYSRLSNLLRISPLDSAEKDAARVSGFPKFQGPVG